MTNINITPGTGKTVSTETIGGVEYQQVKFIDGAVGSTSVLAFVNAGTAIPVSVMGTMIASVRGNVGASIIGVAVLTDQDNVTNGFAGLLSLAHNNVYNGVNWDRWYGNSSIGGLVSTGSSSVISLHYGPIANYVSGVTSVVTVTTAVSVLSAPGANLRNYITHLTVTNGSATATNVTIKDSGANVLYVGYAAASGGGFAASFPVPIKQPTANASIDVVSSSQASIFVSASGYKAA